MLPTIQAEDGHEFPLGCLAEPLSSIDGFWPVYGDVPETPMIPRSRWAEYVKDNEELGPDAMFGYTHDQNGYGMCTNSATTAAMEDTRIGQGMPLIKLSAGDLYRRSGGGQDRGSTLTAALKFAMSEGVARVETVPYLDWRNGRQTGAAEDRARNKILEAFWAPTFDHYASGLLSGFRGVCGISWGGNMRVDSQGWLPSSSGGGGGHALKSFRLARRGNRYGAATDNSWKPTWGKNGRCVIPEEHFRSHFGGCFLVRSVTDFGGIATRSA